MARKRRRGQQGDGGRRKGARQGVNVTALVALGVAMVAVGVAVWALQRDPADGPLLAIGAYPEPPTGLTNADALSINRDALMAYDLGLMNAKHLSLTKKDQDAAAVYSANKAVTHNLLGRTQLVLPKGQRWLPLGAKQQVIDEMCERITKKLDPEAQKVVRYWRKRYASLPPDRR